MTGLEKLREIGAEKIHDKTHIAKRFVEDILNEKYSSMNKIQFAGFVSIIERDYKLDLHELNEAYAAQMKSEEDREPFTVSAQQSEPKEKKNKSYIFGAVAITGLFLAIFTLSTSPDESVLPSETEIIFVENELNSSTIEEAKANLGYLDSELDTNSTGFEPLEELNKTIEEPAHVSKFEIIPKSSLWIGTIDLETFVRTQKLTSSAFELDADKAWLLVMGHGYVSFDVNGEEVSFKDQGKVWFMYEKGTLTKLNRREFKEKNRGENW
jgi:hypothetical protein